VSHNSFIKEGKYRREVELIIDNLQSIKKALETFASRAFLFFFTKRENLSQDKKSIPQGFTMKAGGK